MPRSRFRLRLLVTVSCLALALFPGCAGPASPASAVNIAPVAGSELNQARDLRNAKRFDEAKRIYEAWLSSHPKDPEATFDLGYTYYLQACAETQPDVARQLRLRARELVLRSRQLGAKDADLIPVDASIGTDGSDLRNYRTTPDAEALMRTGETAFAQGNYPAALQAYQSVLQLDPRSYAAALFTGDTYFALKDYARADDWFEKATVIDPSQETAYRYWGDSLMRQSRPDDARQRYLEAIVANPYTRPPHEALAAYARALRIEIRRPAIKHFAADVKLTAKGPEITVEKDPDPLTLAYALSRTHWLTLERGNVFAKDAPPRHSLPEEVHALRQCVQMARELAAKDPAPIAGWKETIDRLADLDRAGLLEAYVLLDSADTGIAQDYEAYRAAHRDVLLRYVREIWLRDA